MSPLQPLPYQSMPVSSSTNYAMNNNLVNHQSQPSQNQYYDMNSNPNFYSNQANSLPLKFKNEESSDLIAGSRTIG